MLIPVKCFTCGNVLANKYRYFVDEVQAGKVANNIDVNKVVYLMKAYAEKTIEGKVLDSLNMRKLCCRRHMLTHVDIE